MCSGWRGCRKKSVSGKRKCLFLSVASYPLSALSFIHSFIFFYLPFSFRYRRARQDVYMRVYIEKSDLNSACQVKVFRNIWFHCQFVWIYSGNTAPCKNATFLFRFKFIFLSAQCNINFTSTYKFSIRPAANCSTKKKTKMKLGT